MTEASLSENSPKSKTLHSTQTLLCHKERSAVQNKKTARVIETASRWSDQQKSLMNRSAKSHPKSQTFYSTQTLVCHEEQSVLQNKQTDRGPITNRSWQTNIVQWDTSILRNALEVLGNSTNHSNMNRSLHGHSPSMVIHPTQILTHQKEQSALQNKKANKSQMTNRSL